MLIHDVVINKVFYLKECKDFRLGKVILEKWDSVGESSYVFGQHFSQSFFSCVHWQECSEGPSDHPSFHASQFLLLNSIPISNVTDSLHNTSQEPDSKWRK